MRAGKLREVFPIFDKISGVKESLAELVLLLYDLAYIERWNDHPKPFHITELDKQAHKAAIAYLIAKIEQREVNWQRLIEGLIFESLQRAILTDIKPPVFHRLLKDAGDKIHEFVLEKTRKTVEAIDPDLFSRMEKHFLKTEETFEDRIIRSAHFLATYWEFQLIYSVGIRFYGIENIKREIEDTIEDYFDLRAVERIFLRKKTFNFIDLVGQLRFQKRWIQSPRVPTTSVLGHMFIVACLSYLLSHLSGACTERKRLNFFTGLFHDLPEVTTRDIISPVKHGAGIEEAIRKLEQEQIESVILPLLPPHVQWEMRYILGYIDEEGRYDEFANRIIEDGRSIRVEGSITRNEDGYMPVDGKLIKMCDVTAAFVEAQLSMAHGLRSKHFRDGIRNMRRKLQEWEHGGFSFGEFAEAIEQKIEEAFH